MGEFVYNIGKGRTVELYNRVKSNSPTNSAFIVVVVNRGSATDDTMKGYDDLAALLGDAQVAEVTNTGYARKTLTDADLAALPAPDDAGDRYDVDILDQTWSNVAAGTAWTDMVVCYDSDTTAAGDSGIIPLTNHTLSVPTPDGSSIVAQIATAGFFRAQD